MTQRSAQDDTHAKAAGERTPERTGQQVRRPPDSGSEGEMRQVAEWFQQSRHRDAACSGGASREPGMFTRMRYNPVLAVR